jgi:hypothetical protein
MQPASGKGITPLRRNPQVLTPATRCTCSKRFGLSSLIDRLWRVLDSATYDLLVLGVGATPSDEVVTVN